MNRLIVPTLFAWVLGGSAARADGPMAEPAARAWAITDAVLAHHVDPPTRQQMLLVGVKALARAAEVGTPGNLASRVSNLSSPDQLAALMTEVLAGPKVVVERKQPSNGPIEFFAGEGMPPEEAFFAGLLSQVSGGATLLSEKERKVQESMEANLYVGIQVQLGVDDKSKRPVLNVVLEGGPADNAGAKDGDVIEEIDGVSTEAMPLAKVVDRLRGAEGTDVLVRFRRPSTDEVFNRPMTRGRLPRATVQGLTPLPGKRWSVRFEGPAPIGYLKVKEISGSTPQELRAFAAQLESEGAKALILDLRETSTAGFHPTVLLADALLDGGVIGRVKLIDGEKIYRAEPDALFRDWPMVVLATTNPVGEVAWLCDALKDNHRATILGEPALDHEPTFRETVALPGGEWSVRLTTGRLERGDGQPLVRQSPKGFVTAEIANIQRKTKEILEKSTAAYRISQLNARLTQLQLLEPEKAEPKPGESAGKPVSDLSKAREILLEALNLK